MFIVLHCGGIPFNGETIRERSLGGSESAAYYVAKELAARGHKVSIFTKHETEGEWDDVRYLFMGNQTEQFPMGDRFHFYATQTPSDVIISQRHPLSFQHRLASKVNILWLHDIALRRNQPALLSTMKQVDRVMTVSQMHKDQIIDSWKLTEDVITPIHNGVDRSLYVDNDEELPDSFQEAVYGDDERKLVLLYQSRPERGLGNLVAPDGIMERLLETRPDARLFVCSYDHDVPAMQGFYEALYQQVEALPNCVNMGSLPKRQLAKVQQHCDLLVYPTEFEEVSCITAMEAMNAGLPMIASKFAALPETCKGAGVKLIKHNSKGESDIPRFADMIARIDVDSADYKTMVEKQLKKAEEFTWERVTTEVECIINECLDAYKENPVSVLRGLVFNSDIIAAEKYYQQHEELHDSTDPILCTTIQEMNDCYQFSWDEEAFDEHYQKGTDAFYDGDFARVGREVVTGSSRFECVAEAVASLDSPSLVIDYGCAHGHYTIELAKRNPDCQFVGIDISERAVAEANAWKADDKVENVRFIVGTADQGWQDEILLDGNPADAIIAAEVLEHVRNPHKLIGDLSKYLAHNGKFIITTPYGPWEQMSYHKDHPTRFHLHHFERADLHDLFGHFDEFNIIACPSGGNPCGDQVGQYITAFRWKGEDTGQIDYDRKFNTFAPRQTVSLCMIAKDAEQTIGKALLSIAGYVDEIIIGIDAATTDNTYRAISQFEDMHPLWPVVRIIENESAIVSGFDEARNETIETAHGDWILWFDSDEEVVEPQAIGALLRNNQYLGYPLPQVHFSINPPQVLNTDYPCRLFRNRRGVQFYGVVHEHPETGLNEGMGPAFIEQAPVFSHNGYITEQVRRARFDRNFPLMERDREKYPDRILGKFLWVRDVAHACQFHLEQHNGMVIPEMREVAAEAIQIWEELLETDQVRMIEDSMQYYSLLSEVLGSELNFGIRVGASRANGGVNLLNEKETNCKFLSFDHMRKYANKIIDEKVKGYETKHF
jgi:glycosyltransferase involved in cell wall biosynthesis/2-polyprenyl-3-methyl-5-hydroxy-6-metoxy-1,4-benzoquinol methylase